MINGTTSLKSVSSIEKEINLIVGEKIKNFDFVTTPKFLIEMHLMTQIIKNN